MRVITFFKSYVTPTDFDAVIAEYPFHMVDGDRNFKSKVTVIVTGSVAGAYNTEPDKYYNMAFYEAYLRTMFPYVISAFKANPHAEEYKIVFTDTCKPFSPDAEWNDSKEIENYVLTF